MPFISICIPAYNRCSSLRRLLKSIEIQNYRDFEVVVTDDSKDDQVKMLCTEFESSFPIIYQKNEKSLGTPENWNEAVRKASGSWIKIMHDDDWFSRSDSLGGFYDLTKQKPEAGFVFSGSSIYEEDEFVRHFTINKRELNLLNADPANLFCKNTIGPPSVVMYRNIGTVVFDNRMKWLVDVDFYIQYLKINNAFIFTNDPLVNVGFNELQVTKQVIHDREVVLPETFLLLQKTGTEILKKIWNYDFAWRLIRNYKIKTLSELKSLNPSENQLTYHFRLAVNWQKVIPPELLKIGIFSKMFMLLNFLLYRFT